MDIGCTNPRAIALVYGYLICTSFNVISLIFNFVFDLLLIVLFLLVSFSVLQNPASPIFKKFSPSLVIPSYQSSSVPHLIISSELFTPLFMSTCVKVVIYFLFICYLKFKTVSKSFN